ncbi:MAG: peptidoglycan-binding protein [Myxococcota bacterium]
MTAKRAAVNAKQRKSGVGTRIAKTAARTSPRATTRSKVARRTGTARRTGAAGAALAASKPLQGVTVPGVDLRRGAEGSGVRQIQHALVRLRLMTQQQMNTGPGIFGPITEAALKKFQKGHGVDSTGVYGPKTRAAFVRLGAKLGRVPKPPPTATLRTKIVRHGKWGVAHKGQIHYRQSRPIDGINKPHKLPLYTDCSGFVTLCYKWAGAPDPNGNGYDGSGYTGTLDAHMRHIPHAKIHPGDLLLWKGKHVSLVVAAGPDPLLVSHGEESGPYQIRFSAQKKGFPGMRPIWLTLPARKRAAVERSMMRLNGREMKKSDPPAEVGIAEEASP